MGPVTVATLFNTTPLAANATFTSDWFISDGSNSLIVSVNTDVDGMVYVDLSGDGLVVDRTVSLVVIGGISESHRVTLTNSYSRIRFTNGSIAQTTFRIQGMLGNFTQFSNPLNEAIAQDVDAMAVKSFDTEFLICAGYVNGLSVVNKFGRNPDVDTGTVPEDVWNGGGVYAGFPTGAAEEFQAFSSDAGDTGQLTFTYLPSFTATEWLSATVTLTGTTPVNTGIVGVRVHTARYSSGNSTGFNLGTITVRHRTTITNIFCQMPIGRSQTYVAAYTVPFGHMAKINRLFCRVLGATAGAVEGSLWIRSRNGSPRLRRPFSSAQQDAFSEEPYGGLSLAAGDDIIVRIVSASANNLDVIAGYDLILIKVY